MGLVLLLKYPRVGILGKWHKLWRRQFQYNVGRIGHHQWLCPCLLYTSGEATLDLAFFRRGSKGKIPIESCSLLPDSMMELARAVRDLLRTKQVEARSLKTLLIRCNRAGECVWQLYLKDNLPELITADEAARLPANGGELIYSDPRSPASRITARLAAFGTIILSDTILDIPFHYATEGFFQINLPVYEQALRDMQPWVTAGHVVDLYSGVGTIGLTIGGDQVTLVEINEDAVREMQRNITALGLSLIHI